MKDQFRASTIHKVEVCLEELDQIQNQFYLILNQMSTHFHLLDKFTKPKN